MPFPLSMQHDPVGGVVSRTQPGKFLQIFPNLQIFHCTPMCKVKQARSPGVPLESKPVSYSWFPGHVGPHGINPGSIGLRPMRNILPNPSLITKPAKVADMIRISCAGICDEDASGCG